VVGDVGWLLLLLLQMLLLRVLLLRMLLLLLVYVAGLLAGVAVVVVVIAAVAVVAELLLLRLLLLLLLVLLLRLDDDQVAGAVVDWCGGCCLAGCCCGHRDGRLRITGTGDHGRHDVGRRQDNRYVVVFTLLAAALAVGVIAADSNTLINHLDLVIWRSCRIVWESRNRRREWSVSMA